MKRHAPQCAPLGGVFWDGGAEVFINKGINGRWREVLGEDDTRAYEARAVAELGADCARWLASGGEVRRGSPRLAGSDTARLPIGPADSG